MGWPLIGGITHLTMEAPLQQGMRFADQVGFRRVFSDKVQLPAAFEPIGLSSGPLPLALYTATQGTQLEIVDHDEPAPRYGAFTGVFGCAPPANLSVVARSAQVADFIVKSGAARAPQCALLGPYGSETWFDAAGGAGGLRALVCRVRDVVAEATFWGRFARVRWGEVDANAAWGAVQSPLPRTRAALLIVGDERAETSHDVNDAGFPSIGVVSTTIESDYRMALDIGATSRGAPITVTVGSRRLRLALIASPGGAPIELLAAG